MNLQQFKVVTLTLYKLAAVQNSQIDLINLRQFKVVTLTLGINLQLFKVVTLTLDVNLQPFKVVTLTLYKLATVQGSHVDLI